MRFNLSLLRFLSFSLFLTFSGITVRAQSDRGSIAGTVLDSSGGVVANAAITVTSTETGTSYSATSGPTGGFRVQDVRVGTYDVSISAPGFKIEKKTGVVVQVNSTASLEFSLQPGDVKETLTVLADAPAVQTETSEIGTVVTSRQIEDLPLALAATGQSHLRSAEAFVFLTPGTVGPGTNSDSGIFESKLAGGQNLGTEVLLDGASISHAELGPTFDENAPSIEAINEFKVTTSTLTADSGRTSGGLESFTTKSGTNSYHGSAFDIFHNDKLNANSWFNNHVGAPKDPDHQNDFGGSLGGPVRIPKLYNGHDKTFFFFSWEQYRNNLGSTGQATLPTDAERTGDFSAILGPALTTGGANPQPVLNPCDGTPVHLGQIFDPATASCPTGFVGGRIAFPGNKITNLSPVAQKMLAVLTVHPNAPGSMNGLINNFIFQSIDPQRDTTMSFRIDQNWGIKDKFFFSYSSRDQEQLNGTRSIPAPLDPNFFKSRFSHYIRFGWDRTISSTLLNHFNLGYNRLHDPSTAQSINGTNWPSVLGIPNANGPVFPPLTFNANNRNIGYQGLSGGNDDLAVPNGLPVSDTVSWIRGRHALRFGFEWRHSQFSRYNNLNTSPNYTFSGFQTAFAPGDPNTGDPFASFLLGLPQQESASFSLHAPRWIQNYYAGFVQDDFKFRKDLTLNLGLRYDVDTVRHEANGIQSVLDLTVPNPGAGGTLGALAFGPNATGAKTYYKDVGPRIGFAYSPARLFGIGSLHNTVVRGGYGIYYAALFYTDFGDSLHDGTTINPSFSSLNSFAPVSVLGKGSLDTGFPAFAPPSFNKDPSLLNGDFQGTPQFAGPSNGRPGMVQNWSFEIQHQLAPDLIFSVGYIGNHATRLNSNLQQLNAIDPKFLPLGNKLNDPINSAQGQADLASVGVTEPSWFRPLYCAGVPAASCTEPIGQLLVPFPQYKGITTNCCLENLGQSTYHALEAKLERRFRNGLNLLASYTYSKTLTDADSAYAGLTAFGSSDTFNAQNPHNLNSEKALSYQDVPHMFVLSYLYELPVGKGKKFLNSGGVVDKVLGGWQIGGVQRYQKGVPFIPFALGQTNAFGTANPRLNLVPGQPLLAPNHSSYNPLMGGSGCTANNDGTFTANGTNNFFNCAAFFDPNAPGVVQTNGYSFGDLPKVFGNVRSPGYLSEDFSLIKRFTLYEANVLSFKADFTNAFNRHTFGRGDGCVTCDTFGQPGSQFGGGPNILNSTKKVQITLRYQF